MQSIILTFGNGQIWLGAPPVVLQFNFVFSTLWSCYFLFAKSIRFVLLLTLGQRQHAFDHLRL